MNLKDSLFFVGPSCWHIVDDGVFSISLSGVRQSPINIETDKNVIETDEALDDLKFEYVPANCTTVGNTGASWKVDVVPDGSSKFRSDYIHLWDRPMAFKSK